MQIDVVIQGGMWPGTVETAMHYARHQLVNKVVISTWDYEQVTQEDVVGENIILLKNPTPDYVGPGNLNLHLASSRNGLSLCSSDVVLKIRSDERMSHEGISTWIEFFCKSGNENAMRYLDGTMQKSKIHVIATNINFPYHPQDHVFIGYKQDLERLFNMPFSYEPPLMPEPIDFSIRTGHLRNPIYIGANYFAMFFEDSRTHLENWKEFLLDEAPKREEAMAFYLENRNSVFKPLPVIDMWWEKFSEQYWWDGYRNSGDRYDQEGE